MASAKQSGGVTGITALCRRLAEPVAAELGLVLWDVRYIKEGASWVLRVFIDREDAPVSINDCVAVSRRLDTLLDEADPISQSYCLEVSSPGAQRELTRPEHFALCAGLPVRLGLYRPQNEGARELTGTLLGMADDCISLETGGGRLEINRKDVSSARLDEDWEEEFIQLESESV